MSAKPQTTRLRIDPITNLPSINTFGELSDFLRSAASDEDSRKFSEMMSQLSVHIEGIISSLRASRERERVAPMLVDFLTVLRNHRAFVVHLGLSWRGLYEYAAYLQALNNFRVLIGQWLLDGGTQSRELTLTAEDFELVAWRTLGEGMLLIDMYEQWIQGPGASDDGPTLSGAREPQVERAVQWWKRLRR
ncbi:MULTISPECIES: hypothetical protein [Ramlibacter]|uniref:Uncharacterized protein n=1 Tax=Ramlibacter aquaticus TaxID=2780094 RepID=A0ABR9SDV1_9BURK|nr:MULTISPECIES: hypothetical protein [Ramlibacter]MBE7940530.1 hypothetical protein [Ramlibacter aquaticus]